jgi:transposase
MIPRKVGDRVKTDRRDAEMLARLWRAGELTPIWTPNEEQEAMRDLIRTRKQTVDALKVAKQQLLSFLATPWPSIQERQLLDKAVPPVVG